MNLIKSNLKNLDLRKLIKLIEGKVGNNEICGDLSCLHPKFTHGISDNECFKAGCYCIEFEDTLIKK